VRTIRREGTEWMLWTVVLAVSLCYFVDCWLAVSKEQSVLDCDF
jgi:hypothetical protein